MKLIAVLNKRLPLGKSLNALAHMAIGLGHRIQSMPGVDVYFGEEQQVREFRHLVQENEDAIASDFTDTMTEETAIEQLQRTQTTKEENLEYFAACALLSTPLDQEITNLLPTCQHLKGYTSTEATNASILLKQEIELPDEAPDYKLAMVITKKTPLVSVLNPLIYTCLTVGRTAELQKLHLLKFIDADGNVHDGISFHQFPILTAKPAKHDEIIQTAQDEKAEVIAETVRDEQQDKPLLTTLFGPKNLIEQVVPRKSTSLFRAELREELLEDIVQVVSRVSPLSSSSLFSSSSQHPPSSSAVSNDSEKVSVKPKGNSM